MSRIYSLLSYQIQNSGKGTDEHLTLWRPNIFADNTLADIIDDPVRDDNENNLWQSQQLLEPDQTFVVLI